MSHPSGVDFLLINRCSLCGAILQNNDGVCPQCVGGHILGFPAASVAGEYETQENGDAANHSINMFPNAPITWNDDDFHAWALYMGLEYSLPSTTQDAVVEGPVAPIVEPLNAMPSYAPTQGLVQREVAVSAMPGPPLATSIDTVSLLGSQAPALSSASSSWTSDTVKCFSQGPVALGRAEGDCPQMDVSSDDRTCLVGWEGGFTTRMVLGMDTSPVARATTPVSPAAEEKPASSADIRKLFISVPQAYMVDDKWTGPFIPQKVYRPITQAEDWRFPKEVTIHEPIFFGVPSSCGIPIGGPGSHNFSLPRGNERVMKGSGASVSIRLMWPGYGPWYKQISSQTYQNVRQPIKLAKLATEMQKVVGSFLEEMRDTDMHADVDAQWCLRRFKMEDLVLVSLHQVSQGSWQPQLRLRHPLSFYPQNV